jgi:hypothetical protein
MASRLSFVLRFVSRIARFAVALRSLEGRGHSVSSESPTGLVSVFGLARGSREG